MSSNLSSEGKEERIHQIYTSILHIVFYTIHSFLTPKLPQQTDCYTKQSNKFNPLDLILLYLRSFLQTANSDKAPGFFVIIYILCSISVWPCQISYETFFFVFKEQLWLQQAFFHHLNPNQQVSVDQGHPHLLEITSIYHLLQHACGTGQKGGGCTSFP